MLIRGQTRCHYSTATRLRGGAWVGACSSRGGVAAVPVQRLYGTPNAPSIGWPTTIQISPRNAGEVHLMRRTIAALALLAVLVGACGAQTVPASVGSVAPGASVAVTQAPDATSVGSVAPGASVAVTRAPDATTAPACVAGAVEIDGVPARTFCGPATANLTLGEKTYNLTGGECQDLAGMFTVRIGTFMFKTATSPGYLEIIVDERYPGAAIKFVVEGTGYASDRDATVVTLDPDTRPGGTFEGLTYDSGIKFSGTFNCT